MTRAAIVGIGFMGWIHYLAYLRSAEIELVGFASRDADKRAGDWSGIQGNFGPPGEQIDISKLTTYGSLEEVLCDDRVDLVDLCTPPHMHTPQVLACLAAGKHVFCEKPLALNANDALRMVRAAQEANRLLLVGHVLPFMSEFKFLTAAAEDRRWGELLGVHLLRTIGPVDWNPDFYDPDRVGGPLVDLHVHDTHLIRLLFGMPKSVDSRGRLHLGVPQYFETLFGFEDAERVVSARGGVIGQHGRPFTHGFEAHFEDATVQFQFAGFSDNAELMPLKVLCADGSIQRPALGSGDPVDAFVAEIDAAAAAVGRGIVCDALRGELAADALVLCQAIDQSVRSGRRVMVEQGAGQ